VNRAVFSPNQPGLCEVDDNWKVDPMAPCTPVIGGVAPSSIQLTVETKGGTQLYVNKYFTNAHTIDR